MKQQFKDKNLPFDNMLVMFFARLPGDRYQKPQKMA
jgi:hypothetical protein